MTDLKNIGRTVNSTAKIKSVAAKPKEDTFKLGDFNLEAKDVKILDEMLKFGSEVIVTIEPQKEDPDFPKMAATGNLTKIDLHKTCQNPTFTGLVFSSDQFALLKNYMKAEEYVVVTIEQPQSEIPMTEETPVEPTE